MRQNKRRTESANDPAAEVVDDPAIFKIVLYPSYLASRRATSDRQIDLL
jgi:hypothetical protein